VGKCVTPGKACKDSFDCDEGQYCEPTLEQCLPQPGVGNGNEACEFRPPVLPFNPKEEWHWESSPIRPEYNQVINTPMVMDLDNDKVPDVVIVTSKQGEEFKSTQLAFVRALNGNNGSEKWGAGVDAYKDEYAVNPRGTPAVGDIDGDGEIEIVAPKFGGGVIAFDSRGNKKWTSTRRDGTAYTGKFAKVTQDYEASVVALADMNNDGKAEVIVGGIVLDSTGKLVSDALIGRETWGANDETFGPVSIVADVDGNPNTTEQYVVTGGRAMHANGELWWPKKGQPPLLDGYPALADFDNDGTPELVVVTSKTEGATPRGYVRVQNAKTGEQIAELELPSNGKLGRGGPPTIADFDNDGVNEIGVANGNRYAVFEYDSKKVGNSKLSVKWQMATQDESSNVTGSSVFDFEGDGKAEVIYNDECYLRVYNGVDGKELFKLANSSATIHDMPVLVDVDGDNNTEFVVVANDSNHTKATDPVRCPYTAAEKPRHGVYVFGDANDRWVRTRKLWNQHAYHITNVDSSGRIPRVEPRNYESAESNNYRVSSAGEGVLNAPNLTVSLSASTASCPAAIELRAKVTNKGTLGVNAGVAVTFSMGNEGAGPSIGTLTTTRALLPGESEVVTFKQPDDKVTGAFYVVVDGASALASMAVNECKEDDNSASASAVRCPAPK